MWTQVRKELPSCLRLIARHSLVNLALLTCACSSRDSGPRPTGTVVLKVTTPESVNTAGATYLLANNQGEPVRVGTLTSEFSPVEIVLPTGPDYVVAVNALARRPGSSLSLECEGFRKFDVFRMEEALINLTLDCGELWPEEPAPEVPPGLPECGIEGLVVGPLRQLIGAEIYAAVAEAAPESRFSWHTSDPEVGRFTHPESYNVSETDFTCETVGETTLTLVVASETCSDRASVQVTCVAWGEPDAGGI